MSQAIHEAIELGDLPKESIGTGGYQSQPTQGQNSQGESEFEFTDSSGPLFSIYLKLAEEEDKKIAERWRADAGGILIFAGLFSAAVAQLVVVSIRDLKPHPQATSDFYLENIYGLLANPDASRNTSVPSLPAKPPPFSPTGAAIWVNSLWFLSLTISLTSALLATLQLLWADRYI
ncbi:hypothetical protein BC826DRAFT_89618 [Russula brevipes]|nr:hypothetical protein BC826DRAFT_89618 [Russula brevipes]